MSTCWLLGRIAPINLQCRSKQSNRSRIIFSYLFFHIFINFSGNNAWFMSMHNFYYPWSKNVDPMSDLSNDWLGNVEEDCMYWQNRHFLTVFPHWHGWEKWKYLFSCKCKSIKELMEIKRKHTNIQALPLPVHLHQPAPFPEACSKFPGFPVWLRGGGQYIRPPPEDKHRLKSNRPNPWKFTFLL